MTRYTYAFVFIKTTVSQLVYADTKRLLTSFAKKTNRLEDVYNNYDKYRSDIDMYTVGSAFNIIRFCEITSPVKINTYAMFTQTALLASAKMNITNSFKNPEYNVSFKTHSNKQFKLLITTDYEKKSRWDLEEGQFMLLSLSYKPINKTPWRNVEWDWLKLDIYSMIDPYTVVENLLTQE